MHEAAQRLHVLRFHQAAEVCLVNGFLPTYPRLRAGACANQNPCFILTERRVKVFLRKVRVRMPVDGDMRPFADIENLEQHSQVGAVFSDMRAAEGFLGERIQQLLQ